jgi:hypothetical protein
MVHPKGLAGAAVVAVAMAGALFTAIARAQQAPPGPAPTGNAMVAGRAIDVDSGQGISGTAVTLSPMRANGPGGALSTTRGTPVLTDSQGRFVFTSLAPGTYLATVDRQGYAVLTLGRTIDIAAGAQVTDFNFRLTKYNSVLGTVRDDGGDPVVGIDVIAFRRSVTSGRPAVLASAARGRTDDRGQYRINQLPAGQYFLCACSRDVIPFDGQLLSTLAARPLDLLSVARRAAVAGADMVSLDSTLRTYTPTFYPNSSLASRAERVSLEKGETKTGVDITVVTVRAVRVSGQIVGAPPSTISANSLRLIPTGDIPEAVAITQLPPILVQPDGRFDFAGVPPGTYTLDVLASPGSTPGGPSGAAMSFVGARGAPPPPPPPPPPGRGGPASPPPAELWASETISVGEQDVTGLVIGIQRGVTIRGKIEFSGTAALPNTTRPGIVQVTPMEVRPARATGYAVQLNPDFTFEFSVPAGRYAMPSIPTFAPAWTTLKSMTARGTDIIDGPLVVDRDISDLVITLTDAPPTQILGTVELPADEVPEEWVVLVFPSDRRYWKEPFGASRRFIVARVTGQRTITARVPPGDYYLTLSRGGAADWMEAPVLEELAKSATSVTLVEGDKKSVQVKR